MRKFLLLGLLPLLFPVSVSADYYRYVDKDGIPRYVDTMKKVPKAYQNQAVYQILPTSAVKEKVAPKPTANLSKEKMELDKEYTALMKEKEALMEAIRKWEEKYKAWEIKKSASTKK